MGKFSLRGPVDPIGDARDNCPAGDNPGQEDADADRVGDACDNCIDVANVDQSDANADGVGDACDLGALTLTWSSDTKLRWSPLGGALSFNVYRGTIPERMGMSSRGFGAISYDHACFASALAPDDVSRVVQDTDAVPVGARAFYYLVAGVRTGGETSLGDASEDLDRGVAGDQLQRPNVSPCP